MDKLPPMGSQSVVAPQMTQSTTGHLGIQKPFLAGPPEATGSRSMVFNAAQEPTPQVQAPRLSAQSDQQSMLSVPMPSVSLASTQTLSAEANTIVNFQL